jgi:hypothetical protein
LKKILFAVAAAFLICLNQSYSQQHKLFTDILSKYVKNGFVDYKSLKSNKSLDEYLKQLVNTNPDKLNINEKLAFWINAYNAFTLQVIIENYPIESINELHTGGRIIGHILGKTVWDKEFITVNSKKYSLNDIEHKILRKMNEPRIHFAIVCASISCPPLRNEAFEPEKISTHLQSQAIEFINDNSRNSFDLKNRKAYLSKMFEWFDEDFGDSEKEVLKYVSQFIPENISKDIKNNLSEWEISYKDYDWNLNKIK